MGSTVKHDLHLHILELTVGVSMKRRRKNGGTETGIFDSVNSKIPGVPV